MAPQPNALRGRRSPEEGRLQLKLRTVEHLARRLGFPREVLESVAQYIDLQYGPSRFHPKRDERSVREIDAPRPLLKRIQRRIHATLLANLWLPDSVHAYRAGRSARSAAAPHAGRAFLWVADIKRFYPSISHRTVYRIFCRLDCTPDVSRLLTRLTTQ